MTPEPAIADRGRSAAPPLPFEDRFLSLRGHRVHYVDEGRGPVLLMLHGNPTWSFLQEDAPDQMARCISSWDRLEPRAHAVA